MALLEVHDLHAGYGAIRALRGLSFAVEQGQVVSLIGANGAGKSTTLNTISGLIKPTQGRVIFDGRDITGWRADRVTALGLIQVPEGRQVIAPMTVYENLIIGARGETLQADLDDIYTRFPRLYERRDQRAGLLSGGEQQMLAVGRGLMAEPRILMIDELSLGLSPRLTVDLFGSLRQLKEEGLTILLVEQNVAMAMAVSDYAYVFAEGKVQFEGPARELAKKPEIREAYLGV